MIASHGGTAEPMVILFFLILLSETRFPLKCFGTILLLFTFVGKQLLI